MGILIKPVNMSGGKRYRNVVKLNIEHTVIKYIWEKLETVTYYILQ